jgi:hypothetical protein
MKPCHPRMQGTVREVLLHGYTGTTGFEPAISGLTGQYVRPLHHVPRLFEPDDGTPSDLTTAKIIP